jgi:hypothetical protein
MRKLFSISAFCFLLSALPSGAQFYLFSTNSAAWGIPNQGIRFFWDYEGFDVKGTNAIRLVNVPPDFAGTNIGFTKMSNGLVVAVTSAESNLFLTLTSSNATWSGLNNATNQRNASIDGAANSFFGTDQMSRFDRALVIGLMNALNNHRTNATTATNLPAYTTNQIITAISNLIRLDPR